MEGENTKLAVTRKRTQKVSPNSVRKVRLAPSPEVATILKRWFGSVRVTYNWTLSCIKNKPSQFPINKIWLRKRFVNSSNVPKDKRYLLDTPKHVRDGAIEDLVLAYATNFSKRKLQPDHIFDVTYRSKKQSQSIVIPYDAIKSMDSEEGMKLYPTYLKNRIQFYTKGWTHPPSYDCRLVMDQLGRFTLHIPNVIACENQAGSSDTRAEWCSLDPGIRTMITVYSPTPGVAYNLADKDISRIYRLCKHLDNLDSNSKGRKMQRAIIRQRKRIRHLVDEVHWKIIIFLTSRFSNIILPPFEVSGMVKRSERILTTKSVRQMLSWRFYAFKTRFQERCKRLQNVNVFIRGEEYTSKTCTHCQHIKDCGVITNDAPTLCNCLLNAMMTSLSSLIIRFRVA